MGEGTHRRYRTVAVIVLMVVLGAACSSGPSEGSPPSPGGTQPVSANAVAADAKPPEAPPKSANPENDLAVVRLDPEPTRAPGEADRAFAARHVQWERSAAASLAARLQELDLGLTVGKRTEVEPAQFGCFYVCNACDPRETRWADVPRSKCKKGLYGYNEYLDPDDYSWKERKPARYEYAQGHTQLDDARLLKVAANLLGRIGDVARKRDVAALKGRVLAVADRVVDLAVVVDELQKAEPEIAELKTKRKAITGIRGFVVASHGDGLYEVAPLQMVSAYRAGYGKHALLRMTSKEFTSRGNFSLWVRSVGQKEIKTTNGFTETWEVYEEAEAEAKSLDAEIRDKSGWIATLRKKQKTLASLDKDRKAVGEAIQRVITQYAQATATAAK